MSKYTIELRSICESLVPKDSHVEYMDVDEVISTARPKIFNFNYPKWNPDYNNQLEEKIIRNYYMREIGLETYGLFKLRLEVKMNEIMPYYNKLYESETLKFDPLKEVDLNTIYTKEGETNYEKMIDRILKDVIAKTGSKITEDTRKLDTVFSQTDTENKDKLKTEDLNTAITDNKNIDTTNTTADSSSGHSESVKNSDTNDWDLYSDTPQGTTSNINLGNNDYLTNARRKMGDTTADDTSDFNSSANQNASGNVQERNTLSNVGDNTITDKEQNLIQKDFTKGETKSGTLNENSTANNTKDTTDNTTETNTRNTLEQYTQSVVGKNSVKSYSALVKEFRHTFLNIDKMVIEELSDLFMNLW